MIKRAVIAALTAGCAVVDALVASGVPVGPLRRLGCPAGLDLAAARLEDRWSTRRDRPGGGHPGCAG